jgi:hypothetical protein
MTYNLSRQDFAVRRKPLVSIYARAADHNILCLPAVNR